MVAPHKTRNPDETKFIHRLIQEYLLHGAYAGTAKVFASECVEQDDGVERADGLETHTIEQKEDQDAVNRQSKLDASRSTL